MILGADFVRYLFSAGGLVCVFLILALWVYRAGRASPGESRSMRLARLALLVTAVAFTLASIYGVEYLVARAIVGSIRPFQAEDAARGKRTAIVILGSGTWQVEDWSGRTAVYPDRAAASRVLEAERVFRLVEPAVVISSGGTPHPNRQTVRSGEGMRDELVGRGVPADRILVETASTMTRDEAVVIAPMLHAQAIEQVILVTSETHMRRSLGTFRAVGIDAIPATAMEFLRRQASWAELLMPSEEGLLLGSENAHEVMGMAYYALRGWYR